MKILLLITCSLFFASPGFSQGAFKPLPLPIEAANVGFISTKDFVFKDSKGNTWLAPAGTITDGASIPQVCMSFVGAPLDNAVRQAALVHDAYCGEANIGHLSYHTKSWQAVHRMFYEACLASGTSDPKAKVMYAAVWLFGPSKWPTVDKRKYQAYLDKVAAYNKPVPGATSPSVATKSKSVPDNPGSSRPVSGKYKKKKKDNSVTEENQEQQEEQEETKQQLLYTQLLQKSLSEIKALDVSSVSATLKNQQFSQIVDFINSQNPSLSTLDSTLVLSAYSMKKDAILKLNKTSTKVK